MTAVCENPLGGFGVWGWFVMREDFVQAKGLPDSALFLFSNTYMILNLCKFPALSSYELVS